MNKPFRYVYFIAAILFTVFSVNGCIEEEMEMTTANKVLSDSLVRVQTKLIIKEIDSLCQLTYQDRFELAVDSISEVRLREIEQYIPN